MEAQKWEWPLAHNDGIVPITNNATRFECDLEMPSFKAKEIDVSCVEQVISVIIGRNGPPLVVDHFALISHILRLKLVSATSELEMFFIFR